MHTRYEWPFVPCDECQRPIDKRDGTPGRPACSDEHACGTCGGPVILIDLDDDEEEE